MSDEAVCVSCPGKVLLTGGYLVLDPAYNGLVLATPSRFYTVVQPAAPATGSDSASFGIDVHSPQFLDGHWKYSARRDSEGQWDVDDLSDDSKNTFVFLAIRAALRLASAVHPSADYPNLRVTIVGSNDFYSQSRSNDGEAVPFASLGVKLRDVHKTGLGSSAAMVTSLVSALFLLWTTPSATFASSTMVAVSSPPRSKGIDLAPIQPDKATLALCHNLAQYVHSLAQGKIGSGFDVSAAVWGSHIYRRFSVECLDGLLDSAADSTMPASTELLKILSPLHNDKWTKASHAPRVSPLVLSPGLTLVLADVDAGSNTPSMVGKVLAWRKKDPQNAHELWEKLKAANADLANSLDELRRTAAQDAKAYESEVAQLAKSPLSQAEDGSSELAKKLLTLSKQIRDVRKMMKQMGEAADVPIEPEEQTRLLDGACSLPGVVGGGVPGAGGYDAIWILVLDSASSSDGDTGANAIEGVTRYLTSYKAMSVRPLSETAWVRGDARGGTSTGAGGQQGLVREDPRAVEGLQAAIMRSVA